MYFYSNLWKAPSTDNFLDVFNALPNDLPKISESDGQFLTHPITQEEVYLTILDLPSGMLLIPMASILLFLLVSYW